MSLETNKTEIGKEFFEIRNILNRNNKIKNEKSELIFELIESSDDYFIIIKSNCADHGLRLATYNKKRMGWELHENLMYENFYNYIYKKIKEIRDFKSEEINITLTVWLNNLWII